MSNCSAKAKMEKNMEKNLQKQYEFYSNLLAQYEKREKCQNSSKSNEQSFSRFNNNVEYSTLFSKSNKLNLVHSQSMKMTHHTKINVNKSPFRKAKFMFKSSKRMLSPVSSFSNSSKISNKTFINKVVKTSLSKPYNFPKELKNYSQKVPCVVDCHSSTVQNQGKSVSTGISSNKKSSKSDSEKLMGEIMALTNQLKLKTESLNFNKKNNHSMNSVEKVKYSTALSDAKRNSNKCFLSIHSALKDCHNFSLVESFPSIKSETVIKSTKNNAQSPSKKEDYASSKIRKKNLHILKNPNVAKKIIVNSSETPKEMFNDKKFLKSGKTSTVEQNLPTWKIAYSTQNYELLQSRLKKHSISCKNLSVKLKNPRRKLSSLETLTSKCQRQKSTSFDNKCLLNCDITKPQLLSENIFNSKYKIINETKTAKNYPKNLSKKNTVFKSTSCLDGKKNMYKLVNNKLNVSTSKTKNTVICKSKNYFKPNYLFNTSLKHLTPTLRKVPQNKSSGRINPNRFKSQSKYHLNKIDSNNSTLNSKKRKLSNSLSGDTQCNGVDVDLLLELAAEKKERLAKSVSHQRFYRSRNRIINHFSVKARTARMIKSKYFRTSQKPLWKNPYAHQTNFEGLSKKYLSNSLKFGNNCNKTQIQSKKSFSRSLQRRNLCLQKKRIVSLEGEKFLVGSTGKTLKKITKPSLKTKKINGDKRFKRYSFVKNVSPVSKKIASRVLNRSINQVLSASVKKKVNTYCMFYNRFGRCNKGVNCPYVHDPSKIAICTRFLRGTCKNDKCLFSHETDPGKMAICTFFLQDACTKNDCPYRHEKLLPNAELCKDFVQGYCASGKECQKAHVLICHEYIRGTCEKGKDCVFPHPDCKDKNSLLKGSNAVKKKDDNILENALRYFESIPHESSVKGLVVPRVRNLPEQPSFISLTMDETL